MTMQAAEILGSKKRVLRLFKPRSIFPERMDHVYFVHTYSSQDSEFKPGHGVQAIRFKDGRLYIDDLPVLKPYFGSDLVTWKQQAKDHFTSGHLHIAGGGTELHGVVYRGSSASDAVQHDVFATSVAPVPYNTHISTSRYPAGTDPNKIPSDGWQTGLTLGIGYEQKVGDLVPVPVVTLDQQDISNFTTWSIDPKTQNTVLLLALDPSVVCDFDSSLYLQGSVEFDVLQVNPTFSGTLSSTCADQSGTGVYLWKGEANPQAAALTDDRVTAHFLSAMNFSPLAITEDELVQDDGLSVADLMSIVPDDSVSQTANDLLVENMKWAMAQDSDESKWLSKYFGEQPPVLSPSQQAVASKSLSWYQGHFAKSYLGWSFANYAGPNAPSVNLNADQKLKLKNFMQTGMAKDDDFNTQQNGVYLTAFIQAQPRLQNYINDTASNWAQQLFNVITSPAQMTLMINRVFGAAGEKGTMTPANNFATLLSALQPSAALAQQYIQAVLSGTLSNCAHQTTTTKDIVMEWLPDFLQEFLDQIAHGGTVPDEAALAAQQLRDMMQEMGGNISTVAGEIADFLVNANGANILQKTQTAETAFVKKWPKFAKVGQMMFFAAWCMGVVMVIKAFQNWSNLSPEDKAKTVTSAVTLGLEGLEIVPKFIQGVKEMGLDGWKKFTEWRNSLKAEERVGLIQEEVDPDWVENGAKEVAEVFDAEGGVIKAEGTLWDSILETGSKVIGVLGICASAALAVMSTIDFVNDIKSGQPITKEALDGIMMVTNIAMTVCLVLDLVVASTVFAMAGAVFAIIGMIVAIVMMFESKPKNPLDDFMSDVIIPFVDGLPPQTPPPNPSGGSTPTLVLA